MNAKEIIDQWLSGLSTGGEYLHSSILPPLEKLITTALAQRITFTEEWMANPNKTKPETFEEWSKWMDGWNELRRLTIKQEQENQALKAKLEFEKAAYRKAEELRESIQHNNEALKVEVERLRILIENQKAKSLVRQIAAICEKCGGHKANDMCTDCQLDHIDLMRDEFIRIKALTANNPNAFNSEVAALCDRAIQQTDQNVPVIVRCDNAEKELDEAQRLLGEAGKLFKWIDNGGWSSTALTGVIRRFLANPALARAMGERQSKYAEPAATLLEKLNK